MTKFFPSKIGINTKMPIFTTSNIILGVCRHSYKSIQEIKGTKMREMQRGKTACTICKWHSCMERKCQRVYKITASPNK